MPLAFCFIELNGITINPLEKYKQQSHKREGYKELTHISQYLLYVGEVYKRNEREYLK